MGATTKIEWCDKTFSPWTGCAKVSPGCAHCYAEALSKRTGLAQWGPNGTRRRTSENYWKQPLKWNRDAERAGVRTSAFPSLCDPFEVREDLAVWREEFFALIDATPWVNWLLLTKRPENIVQMTPPCKRYCDNVWLGTSVENQETADERIPHLVSVQPVPAIRFLSCEPLLGPIDLGLMQMGGAINWVIVGGESGHGARACWVDWIVSIRDQCQAAAVPVFIKQLGAKAVICDEETGGCPVHLDLSDKKGGDWSEWPEDLRVREFPSVEVSA